MLRASSYNVYVDLPEDSDIMLLVHGYLGSYDRVSKRIATYVRSLEVHKLHKPLYGDWTPEPDFGEESTLPSDSAIDMLKKRGYLTEKTVEEEEKLFCKVAELIHKKNSGRSPSYIFMPTYNCNLRCSYCFQDHMRTNPAFKHLLR